MPITVNLPTILSKLADGARVVEADASAAPTVGAVVDHLVDRYPGLGPRLRDDGGQPYPFVTFYLNDDDIRFNGGFAAAVQDGDEVTIVPAIAGG
ncbi:MAG: MoaD/ThiS family protein [Gemmatimonadota bacterium]|nr:MoaD/ThiS family protein [Gemmatimonadota bacterium]HEU4988650.1 MoaD/ThiS family protein [Gemmatimonadaceae bacterium]